ncbi:CapA family protein [Pseudoalteromonas luteoviolacea]|uniref:CapA family protein n=1 Tax=Pseudoalteromonas luteoviolacea TaxID=43657 RepID=UPI001150A974|nr:CapA family protein [Pseudoalteromonas luteoviolacea]TQF69866.1 CapA family protein [Pseudoalteromonas luteoviolacea]
MKIAKNIALVLTAIFTSACSVEDPYETGPTQSQQEEQSEQDKENAQSAAFVITVKDETNNIVKNATVNLSGVTYTTDDLGQIAIPSLAQGNYTIAVEKSGFKSFLTTLQLESETQDFSLNIESKSNQDVSLFFAGDTMFGRRYMDPSLTTMGNSVPDVEGALIRASSAAANAISLTQYVKPLVEAADFASVNLETPILATPTSVHPTKEFAFFSLPETLQGLTEIGVDYVALGNNHVYDYLQNGLQDTLKYVNEAGLLHSGAGNNDTEAFAPLITSVNGLTVGIVSATSITGEDNPIDYIAREQKGGAADLTDTTSVRSAVESSIARSDYAIAQLHGGDEYSYAPTRYITNRFEVIGNENPDLLIAHHPHVAQGFGLFNGTPALLGLGNFVFEQNRIETLLGVAVVLEVNPTLEPKTRSARAYPIYLEDYQPKLVTGFLSDYLMRRLGEFSDPNVSVIPRQGYADISFTQTVAPTTLAPVQVTLPAGQHIVDLREYAPSNAFLTGINTSQSVSIRMGRDLMLFGDFEDWDNDEVFGEVSRWENDSDNITPCLTGAHRGRQGMCLVRTQFDNRPLRMPFKHTIRTMPITPGESTLLAYHDMSLYGYSKGQNAGELSAEMSILTSEDNLVFSEQTLQIKSAGDYNWQSFSHTFSLPDDTSVLGPENLPARAVKITFLHSPPAEGEATLMLDDIALISWQRDITLNIDVDDTWQENTIHGLDFLQVNSQKDVTLSLTFSSFQ